MGTGADGASARPAHRLSVMCFEHLGGDRQVPDPVLAASGVGIAGPYRLYGRERELGLIGDLIGRLSDRHGGAMVITGDPGTGKTALLTTATAMAKKRRVRVLTAAGVRSEAGIAFAGLHRLLQPLLHLAGDLPARQ
jgi:hypothetical protein